MEMYFDGELELRARGGGGRTLRGLFPYGRSATVRDRGRVRKERFKSRAFGWQIEEFERLQGQLNNAIKEGVEEAISELTEQISRRDVNLLSGHSFNRPLASLKGGSLKLKDSDRALTFEADLPSEDKQPSWMRDTLLSVESGLAVGVSPGFRIPPKSVVPDAERLVDEPGNPGVQIREISQAVLYELSIVTRPAYGETTIEAREDAQDVLTKKRRLRLWL